MRYELYFVRGGFPFSADDAPPFPHDYEHIAAVDAATPDGVFMIAQNIEAPWVTHGAVQNAPSVARSMVVGDVVVDPDGRRFVCDNIGFKEIV